MRINLKILVPLASRAAPKWKKISYLNENNKNQGLILPKISLMSDFHLYMSNKEQVKEIIVKNLNS